jgi:uncharacterized membrane protein YphA (DoxX/SURF4 family)
MADTKTLDYGWFFLRLSVGLILYSEGADHLDIDGIDLHSLALVLVGISLILGLLVRPAVIFMLIMMVTVFVSGSQLEFNLVRESMTDLFAMIAFLIGGGGSFLALGAAISGLKGKWYQ